MQPRRRPGENEALHCAPLLSPRSLCEGGHTSAIRMGAHDPSMFSAHCLLVVNVQAAASASISASPSPAPASRQAQHVS